MLGDFAVSRGDDRAAAAHYEAAVDSHMHEVTLKAWLGLAAARRRLGDASGARTAYEQAIAQIEAARERTTGDEQRTGYLDLHARAYRELVGLLCAWPGGPDIKVKKSSLDLPYVCRQWSSVGVVANP
jgi:hypothetical protein